VSAWCSSMVESVDEADCSIASRFSSGEQPLLRRRPPTVESAIERLTSSDDNSSDDDTSVAVSLAVDILESSRRRVRCNFRFTLLLEAGASVIGKFESCVDQERREI